MHTTCNEQLGMPSWDSVTSRYTHATKTITAATVVSIFLVCNDRIELYLSNICLSLSTIDDIMNSLALEVW